MLRLFIILLAFTGPLYAEATVGLSYLRHYCKSCHGIGKNRFIVSDSDEEVLEFILNESAPSGDLWIDAIVDTLNWPGVNIPGIQDKTSRNRRYMPLGSKREDISEDQIDGRSARLFLFDLFNSTPDVTW